MILSTQQYLTRTSVWSNDLKEALKDELNAQGYVRWLTEFPDGDTFRIPSIGEGTVRDYVENTPVVYDSLATGEFTFTITEYKQSGNYITKKAQQDLYYSQQLEGALVPKQARALAEVVETDILALARGQASSANPLQLAGDANSINGAAHRFVGSGTAVANQAGFAFADFAKALYGLKRANVPDQALIAIVDPSVEYTFNTLSNVVSMSNNPRWEGIMFEGGIGAGMRFTKNIFGFDVYVSNYLPKAGATQNGTETITTAVSNSGAGICNILCSLASPEIVPFIGAWRQQPEIDSDYNKDLQRFEYLTTARYGLKLYRPENLVVCLTSTAVVA